MCRYYPAMGRKKGVFGWKQKRKDSESRMRCSSRPDMQKSLQWDWKPPCKPGRIKRMWTKTCIQMTLKDLGKWRN